MRKREAHRHVCQFRATFYDTSFSVRVYLSMDTPRRDVAGRTFCQRKRQCRLTARDSRWIGFVILSSLCTLQQMCLLKPWLIPSMHRDSRSGHSPRCKYHVYALPQRVATYQFAPTFL